MNRTIILFLVLFIVVHIQAQVSKTVNITAGTLSSVLTSEEKSNITDLTITGTIDARDFVTLRDSLFDLRKLYMRECSVVEYNGTLGTVGAYNKYRYDADVIPLNAFYNEMFSAYRRKLEMITLPSGTVSIGENAFYFCQMLKTVVFNSKLTSIDKAAFKYCFNLESVSLPYGFNFLGNEAFSDCQNLKSIELPDALIKIGDDTFYECGKLTSINFPSSLKSIGENAFRQCVGLTYMKIPSSVVSIGRWAFSGCERLDSVDLSTNLQFLDAWAFSHCSQLKKINIPSALLSIDEGTFAYCSSLRTITIPHSVITIKKAAFYGCTSLKKLNIPSTVVNLEEAVFAYCSSLTDTLIIPSSINSISNDLFKSCSGLTSLVIPSSITKIGWGAFSACEKLAGALIIPSSVDTIFHSAFDGCLELDSLVIPESVVFIGESAFSRCNGLKSIYSKSGLPIKLNDKYYVFEAIDKAICSLYVPYGSSKYYSNASLWMDFDNIIELPGLGLLSNEAFIEAETGSTDTIPINSNVNWKAESNQPWLTVTPLEGDSSEMLILTADENPNFVQRKAEVSVSVMGFETQIINVIQREAAYQVDIEAGQLSHLLPDSLLNSLTRLIINGQIDSRDFKTMRDSMPNLEDINLTNASIASYVGVLGTSPVEGIVEYPPNTIPEYALIINAYDFPSNLKSILLPETLTCIDNYAFKACHELKKIKLPSKLKTIKTSAFAECTGLSDVIFPSNLDSIGSNAFFCCYSLISINLPDSLRQLSDNVFSNCLNLTSVNIPNTVRKIDYNAFLYCPKLRTINFPPSIQTIGKGSFNQCYSLDSIILPSNIKKIESDAFGSCNSLKSIIIPNSIRTIEEGCFALCSNLESVLLPFSTDTIKTRAFNGCSGLMSLTIPPSVKVIGEFAFEGCRNIKGSLTIPSSAKSIESYAFMICLSIDTLVIPSSLVNIGSFAFSSCYNLKEIYSYSEKPINLTFSSNVFSSVNHELCNLRVPYGSKHSYEAANQWQDFEHIIEMPGLNISKTLVGVDASGAKSDSIFLDSNTSWEVGSDQNWLIINKVVGFGSDTLLFVAEDNLFSSKRTAIVTLKGEGLVPQFITVKQEAGDTVMSLSTTTTFLTKEGESSGDLVITSNTSWSAVSDSPWLTVSPTDGNGDSNMILIAEVNPTISERTAKVTVLGKGFASQFITATQEAGDTVISLSATTTFLTKEGESSGNMVITSNTSWSAASDSPWLTVSPTDGIGDSKMILIAEVNPTISERVGKITIQGSGFPAQYLTVTQEAGDTLLSLSTTNVSLTKEGESVENVVITSNTSWSTVSDSPWITVSPEEGNGNTNLSLIAEVNPTILERTAKVAVNIEGLASQFITVIQEAGDTSLTVSSDSIFINSEGGIINMIDINSNTNWNAVSDVPWLNINPEQGFGNSVLTVIAEPNPERKERFSYISISTNGSQYQMVFVRQEANQNTAILLQSDGVSIYPNPAKEFFFVDGLKNSCLLSLTDIYGKVLVEKTIISKDCVSVNTLPSGVYFVHIFTNHKTIAKKLIKK